MSIMPEEAINLWSVRFVFTIVVPNYSHLRDNGGDDDALCLGFTIPIVGLLIGIGVSS